MVDQPSKPRSLRATRAAAVAFAPGAVLAAAIVLLNPAAELEQGLSAAAAAETRLMAEAVGLDRSSVAVANRPFEEGSEGFWLTRAPEAESVARVSWTAPVAAGDRVVVNFGAYDREILDIVSVAEVRDSTTRIDTSEGKLVRYVITGRRLGAPESGLVQLTVDQDGRGLTPLKGERDRAL